MACLVIYLEDESTNIVSLDNVEVLTVGRHPDSNLYLKSPSVSAHHALIKKRSDGVYAQDLGSSNGTRVNGAEVEESKLKNGDRVAFGDVQGVFHTGAPPPDGAPPPKEERTVPKAHVPLPDAQEVAEARPVVGAAAPRRALRARRFVRASSVSSYPDQTGSGCLTATFLIGLFIVAFIVGLALRHLKETDRNLISDVFSKVFDSMPKLKIERDENK